MSAWMTLAMLVVIGAVHSALGEAVLVGPLVRDPSWRVGISGGAARRVLRFAWHLTSVAWVGLGATVVGAPPGLAVGLVCLVSAAVVFGALRSHLAWPLFLFAGLAALHAEGRLPEGVRLGAVSAAVGVAGLAALLHLYWAVGGRWGWARALPSGADGRPAFQPGPLACVAVAGALVAFAGLLVACAPGGAPGWVRAGTWAALGVLLMRAVGDRRQVGFSKRQRRTPFAQADDALFTPLVVLLALGAGFALVSV